MNKGTIRQNKTAQITKPIHMRKNDDQKRPVTTMRLIGKPNASAIIAN